MFHIFCLTVYNVVTNWKFDIYVSLIKARANVYICDYCNETFNNKMLLLKHIINHMVRRPTNIYCSFENCDKTFKTMKSLTHHLESDHNENIKVEHLKFETMEGK